MLLFRAAPLSKSFTQACGCGNAKGAGAASSVGVGRGQSCRWVHRGKLEAGGLGGPSALCKGGQES